MLIDERHHRQHSPTFDERLTYGDTDRNLGHTVNCIPPPSHAPCGRPLVTFGAAVAPLALAYTLPPRFVGAFPYPLPLPHVDRHLSGSAALVRLSRRPKPFLHPLPPHVGVGFRHTQIAGWGRASGRRRFYPVTHLDVEGSVQRAASRTPARAVGEGRGARPRATNEQLVGVGQGVCALPSRREGI